MLSNNIAYLFLEEECLEFFNKSESSVGMIIGSVKFFHFKFFLEKRKKRNSQRNNSFTI
jgi:hypothetical protein